MFDPTLTLVIGAIGLPAFGEVVLWALHKVGMGNQWDTTAGYVVSLVFAGIVVTAKFFPGYDTVVVGAITAIYTFLTTMRQLVGKTVSAIRQ